MENARANYQDFDGDLKAERNVAKTVTCNTVRAGREPLRFFLSYLLCVNICVQEIHGDFGLVTKKRR